jgi:anti-anti-sigma factor
MDITEERHGQTLVMAVNGRIDALAAKAFETTVLTPVQTGEAALLLDLGGLTYISSAGLRVILLAAKQQKAKDAKFALCNLRDEVRDVFEISGFAKILDIHPSREAARRVSRARLGPGTAAIAHLRRVPPVPRLAAMTENRPVSGHTPARFWYRRYRPAA